MGDQQESIEALLPRGQAKVLFADDVSDALTSVELAFDALSSSLPMVVMAWPKPPRIDAMIESMVVELAQSALSAWPDWRANRAIETTSPTDTANRNSNYGHWRSVAESLAATGEPPLPPGFSHADHVRYLADVIADSVLIVIAVENLERSTDREDPHLDGLCRAAAWLSEQSRSRVAILIDRRLQGCQELASVDYESLEWSDLIQPDPSATIRQSEKLASESPSTTRGNRTSDATFRRADEVPRENKLRFWPILDRPHPDSPGEQRLCEALATDPLLSGLFRFNQIVVATSHRRYIVDLLNDKDRLIVEVDGYQYHRSRFAFNADRLRDFHLITSGYVVIRIPHEEVMHDVRSAVEKIRTLVRFRRHDQINSETM